MSTLPSELEPDEVRVWDPFVRIFHWGLVACIALNEFVIDDGERVHQWIGYAASALVLARIVWGFVGTRHARFSDFWPTPARLRAHLADLLAGRHGAQAGHNPLGALLVLALLAVVLALGASGWLQTTDAFWGEEWLQELHEELAEALLGLAGVHVAAALLMSGVEHTNLVAAMVSGIKRRRPH